MPLDSGEYPLYNKADAIGSKMVIATLSIVPFLLAPMGGWIGVLLAGLVLWPAAIFLERRWHAVVGCVLIVSDVGLTLRKRGNPVFETPWDAITSATLEVPSRVIRLSRADGATIGLVPLSLLPWQKRNEIRMEIRLHMKAELGLEERSGVVLGTQKAHAVRGVGMISVGFVGLWVTTRGFHELFQIEAPQGWISRFGPFISLGSISLLLLGLCEVFSGLLWQRQTARVHRGPDPSAYPEISTPTLVYFLSGHPSDRRVAFQYTDEVRTANYAQIERNGCLGLAVFALFLNGLVIILFYTMPRHGKVDWWAFGLGLMGNGVWIIVAAGLFAARVWTRLLAKHLADMIVVDGASIWVLRGQQLLPAEIKTAPISTGTPDNPVFGRIRAPVVVNGEVCWYDPTSMVEVEIWLPNEGGAGYAGA